MDHSQVGTNSFKLLVDSGAFMAELSAALRDCRRTLYAQFLTYDGDDVGDTFSDLLIGKAAQGVEVRLIVDGYTDVIVGDLSPLDLRHWRARRVRRARTLALYERLARGGVVVRRTAPPGFLAHHMFYRNHKKMVVLDEQVAFVGGINVSAHNFTWHDFMVRIEGPLVRDLARDFASTWLGGSIHFDRPAGAQHYLVSQCAGRPSIFEETLRLIEHAQRTVVIESPYLLGDRIEVALWQAAERNVRVTLISPYKNNQLMFRLWQPAQRRHLDHPNITILGYQGNKGMTHAKLLLVDDTWASFGSCNFFELEALTLKDLNVVTNSPALIDQFQALIAADLARSVRLVPPRMIFGRFTYDLIFRIVSLRTHHLLRRARWKAVYC